MSQEQKDLWYLYLEVLMEVEEVAAVVYRSVDDHQNFAENFVRAMQCRPSKDSGVV